MKKIVGSIVMAIVATTAIADITPEQQACVDVIGIHESVIDFAFNEGPDSAMAYLMIRIEDYKRAEANLPEYEKKDFLEIMPDPQELDKLSEIKRVKYKEQILNLMEDDYDACIEATFEN